MNIKIGDRIRVINDSFVTEDASPLSEEGVNIGDCGTVIRISTRPDDNYPISIIFDNGTECYCSYQEIEIMNDYKVDLL